MFGQRALDPAFASQHSAYLPRVGLVCMPLFRIEKPENASLWMRMIKGIDQLNISLSWGSHEESRQCLQVEPSCSILVAVRSVLSKMAAFWRRCPLCPWKDTRMLGMLVRGLKIRPVSWTRKSKTLGCWTELFVPLYTSLARVLPLPFSTIVVKHFWCI